MLLQDPTNAVAYLNQLMTPDLGLQAFFQSRINDAIFNLQSVTNTKDQTNFKLTPFPIRVSTKATCSYQRQMEHASLKLR